MTRSVFRSMVLALGATALLAGIAAAPARADDDWRQHERRDREDWRDRDERREEWRERAGWRDREWHEWCFRHPGAYAYPGYVCPMPAPPTVYYAPPSYYAPPPAVIYTPPPSLEIVVPFHIR
jgi:Domain of unknwon function (DUF3824)